MSQPPVTGVVSKVFDGLGAAARVAIRWVLPAALLFAIASLIGTRLQMAQERELSRRILAAASAIQFRVQSEFDRCVRRGWECSLKAVGVDPDTPDGYGEKRASILVGGKDAKSSSKVNLALAGLVPGLRDPNSGILAAFLAQEDGRLIEEFHTSSARRFVELELAWGFKTPAEKAESNSKSGSVGDTSGLNDLVATFRSEPTSVRADPVLTPISLGRHEFLLAITRLRVVERLAKSNAASAPTSDELTTTEHTYYLAALSRRSTFPVHSRVRSAIREVVPFALAAGGAVALIALLWLGARDGSLPRHALVLLLLTLSLISTGIAAWVAIERDEQRRVEQLLLQTVEESDAHLASLEEDFKRAESVLKSAAIPAGSGSRVPTHRCGVLSREDLDPRGLSYFLVDEAGMQLCLDSRSGSKPVDVADRNYFLLAKPHEECGDRSIRGPYFIVGWQDASPRLVLTRRLCAADIPKENKAFANAVLQVVTFAPEPFRAQVPTSPGAGPTADTALRSDRRAESSAIQRADSTRLLLLEGDRVRFSVPPSYQSVGWAFGSQVSTLASIHAAIASRKQWAEVGPFDDRDAAIAVRPFRDRHGLLVATFLDEAETARLAISRSLLRLGFWIWLPPLLVVATLAVSGGRSQLVESLFPQRRPGFRYWMGALLLATWNFTLAATLVNSPPPEALILGASAAGVGSILILLCSLVDSQHARKWELRLAGVATCVFLIGDFLLFPLASGDERRGAVPFLVGIAQFSLLLVLVGKKFLVPHMARTAFRRTHRFGYSLLAGLGITSSFLVPTMMAIQAPLTSLEILSAGRSSSSSESVSASLGIHSGSSPLPACLARALASPVLSGAECLLSDTSNFPVERVRVHLASLGEADFASSGGHVARSGAHSIVVAFVVMSLLLALGWAGACGIWFGWSQFPKRHPNSASGACFSTEERQLIEVIRRSRLPAWRLSGAVRSLAARGVISTRDGLALRNRRATRLGDEEADASASGAGPRPDHRWRLALLVLCVLSIPALIWALDNPQILKSAAAWVSALLAANGLRMGKSS